MKTGTFIAEVGENGKIPIPQEIIERLHLAEGDKIEILLKKIRFINYLSSRTSKTRMCND